MPKKSSTKKANEISTGENNKDCICQRPKSRIVCGDCGYSATGRIQKKCNLHENVTFISDYNRCPGCPAWSYMMAEYDLESELD